MKNRRCVRWNTSRGVLLDDLKVALNEAENELNGVEPKACWRG